MFSQPSWCSNCLAMSTRRRITFDDRGFCNACRWMEQKKSLDWDSRNQELLSLLEKHKSNDGSFDCLVPVSGGKDGSYVAHQLKHVYGMNPLCVTVTPALPLDLGENNLKSFVNSGYNHISVNLSSPLLRDLNKYGLFELGFPYYGWLMGIHTVPVRISLAFNINLIFYGENGEVEYGGTTETIDNPVFDVNFMKRIFLEEGYGSALSSIPHAHAESYLFRFPSDADLNQSSLEITHWSYYENWDPYRNYLVAKEHCGLAESPTTNQGTFTNFSQNDQALYALHTYLMYLKFGFGRANQDASIEVRRGAMTRGQALNLVRLYDGAYPDVFIEKYLDYYEITLDQLNSVFDRWANRDLFQKQNGRWVPTFTVQ